LHFTKGGTYKGSTLLPHSVDCNIVMSKSKDNPAIREIEVTKNRYGSSGYTAFMMTPSGFTFEKVEQDDDATDKNSKKSKTAQYKDKIMAEVATNGKIDLKTATILLDSSLKAQQALRELVMIGTIKKAGRGVTAIYTS
jgi:hypothetical protein